MLDPAGLSLAALVIVVLASCTTRVNPGLLALALAWAIGVCPASLCGTHLGHKAVLAGFPASLFLTLVGVTLLFALVQDNGTLDRVARRAVRACGGRRAVVPVVFFLVAAGLGTAGAGNIAPAALVAPVAMGTARRLGIPAFPMAIMVTHGSIAGGMSPIGPAGAIVAVLCREKLGMPGAEWTFYIHNLLANAAVAFAGFTLFGGLRRHDPVHTGDRVTPPAEEPTTLAAPHRLTLAVLVGVAAAVLGFGADVGMAALAGAVVLIVLRLADEDRAVRGVPWGVVLMVCGVSTLTAVLEQTGGTERLSAALARVATPGSAPPLMALVCGVVSVYSSTTGVVLPAFLPLVPGLAARLPGCDPMLLASAVVVGGNLSDSSPLSTIGALCLAAAAGDDRRALFRKLLAWGLVMPFVAAIGYAVAAAWG
jgi:Na+/H+ antiporter NhaD/arsenite permease-like protein